MITKNKAMDTTPAQTAFSDVSAILLLRMFRYSLRIQSHVACKKNVRGDPAGHQSRIISPASSHLMFIEHPPL